MTILFAKNNRKGDNFAGLFMKINLHQNVHLEISPRKSFFRKTCTKTVSLDASLSLFLGEKINHGLDGTDTQQEFLR
jgi:hypothetical protein